MSGPWQPVIQGIAIIGLVIAGMFIVYRFIRQMTRKDAEQ
jgi:flagellar biogenesis protein FliO